MPNLTGAAGRPPHRRLWSATLALALVAALAAGCTKTAPAPAAAASTERVAPPGAAAPVDPAAWALVARLTAPTYSADTTTALVAGLARSGIGTFADPTATRPEQPVSGPASPMRLLDFQVHALAVGAWASAGFTGAELDTVAPHPDGVTGTPTTSELLAGYVAAADSPGGALSRALMSGQNLLAPQTLRFPGVVLILFAADLAANPGGSPNVSANARPARAAAPRGITIEVEQQAASGICSATANWINNAIVGLFNALKLATADNLPGAIASTIWNWLVDAAQAVVQNLISTVTDAVLGTIRSIAASVAAVAEQIASFLPYAVKVVASGDGGGATFTLGPTPLVGTFTASVTAGDLPTWPAVLADCASVAQVALPDFHAKDAPLTWGPVEPVAEPMLGPSETAHATDVTDADGRSSWGFRTSIDPGDPNGEQRNQVDYMPVSVHRPDIERARARLTDALLGFIPGLLRPFVASLFKPYIDGLQARLNVLLDARGRGAAVLIFHAGTRPTPTPPSPVTSNACAGRLSPGNYSGTNTNTFTDRIPMTGGALVDHNDATGPVTMTMAADGSLTGTWTFHSREVTDESMEIAGVSAKYHTVSTWGMTTGTISGSACHLRLTSGIVRRLTCVGTCGTDTGPASQAGTRDLGAPVSAAPGHVTWRWKGDAADGTYTDTFTISVTGPS